MASYFAQRLPSESLETFGYLSGSGWKVKALLKRLFAFVGGTFREDKRYCALRAFRGILSAYRRRKRMELLIEMADEGKHDREVELLIGYYKDEIAGMPLGQEEDVSEEIARLVALGCAVDK